MYAAADKNGGLGAGLVTVANRDGACIASSLNERSSHPGRSDTSALALVRGQIGAARVRRLRRLLFSPDGRGTDDRNGDIALAGGRDWRRGALRVRSRAGARRVLAPSTSLAADLRFDRCDLFDDA